MGGRIPFLCLLLGIYVDYALSTGTTLTLAAALTSPAPVQLPNMTLVASETTVTTGSSVTLTCSAFAQNELSWSGPSGSITNFMNGNGCFRLTETDAPDISHISITCGSGSGALSDWTISTLTISSFDPGRDAGYWECSDFTTSIADTVYLNSTGNSPKNIDIETSTPGLITRLNDMTVLEEESETLTCTAECTGNCQYTWKKGGELVASTSQLPLNDINSTMGGLYICHVSYNGVELTKSLSVLVLSRDFIKFDPPGDLVTLFEGQTISINCFTEKDPMCNLFGYMCQNYWDALPNVANVAIINPSNTNIFVINNATVSQAGIYRCIYAIDDDSSNTHWFTYRTLPIQVLVPYGPSTVVITPSSDPVTITNGESLTFNCSADCQPGCNYTWKYNNGIVSTVAIYTINSINTTHSGIYTCTATNIVGNVTKSTNVVVNNGPSSIVITPTSDPVTITNGESLSLVCSADCQPDCNYTWTHNNVTVSTMATYTINGINTSQSGIYICTVANSLGTESKSTNVVVNAPSVQLPNMTLIASETIVTTGSSVTLTCSAFAQNELTWSGPPGMITIFMNGCFRLTENDAPDISHMSITCSGSGAESDWTISTLTISSFDPGRDTGYWRCSDTTKSIGDTVYLNSTEPGIKNIKIRSSTGFISSTNDLTLLSEESDVLTCTAQCTGICQYKWMKGTDLVVSTSQLSLNNINATLGGLYTCIATYYGSDLKRSLRIYVQDRSSITINPPSDIITVNEGDSITITCSVDGYPCNNINGITCTNIWDTLSGSFYNTGQENSMVINMATRSMTGRYRCIHVEDEPSSNTHTATYKSIQLQVQYGPSTVVITPSSDPVTITNGESLTFNCSADCQPGCNYTWKYNNVIVSTVAIYTINSINTTHSGIYTCTATNIVGNVTKSTNVVVNNGPSSIVITPTSDPVTITNGESLSLVCSADCQPDCNYTWTHNNVTVSTMATYTINGINTSQSGIYICTVANSLGTESKSTNVVVNAPSVQLPNMTLIASETIVTTGSSVTLTCSAFAQNELTWSGPPGMITIFMNGCFRLTENDAPDISHMSITCSGSGAESDWTISTLTISSFDPGRDTGYWRCSDTTKSIGDTVYLNSTEPGIKNIKITSSTGFISSTNDLTLLSEESDVLTCTAQCTGICQYKWMKGTDLVASTSQLSLNNINSTLGGLYTCIVTYYGSELKRSLRISVQDRSFITINPPSDIITVNEGDSITITCSVDGYPCNNINGITCTNIWDTLSGSFYNTGQGNSMVINMATRSMTGRYRCIHVEDEPSSNTLFETYKSIQLQVQYEPSSVVITPSSDPVTITSGESLSFNCSADCQPGCNYTWKYNNVIVSNMAIYNTSHSGVYTCTATNTLGSMTKSTNVQVTKSTNVPVTESTNVQVNYGPSSVITTRTEDPVIYIH
ncbi:hemicentin-1 [Patella vulgata]|uniref:hemicentin-1 n=1 Tax=Patella vulgata TaxID=6465 RepID=UPI0024A97A9D|nr:hemicentin-1 [Patella vulgata]